MTVHQVAADAVEIRLGPYDLPALTPHDAMPRRSTIWPWSVRTQDSPDSRSRLAIEGPPRQAMGSDRRPTPAPPPQPALSDAPAGPSIRDGNAPCSAL